MSMLVFGYLDWRLLRNIDVGSRSHDELTDMATSIIDQACVEC